MDVAEIKMDGAEIKIAAAEVKMDGAEVKMGWMEPRSRWIEGCGQEKELMLLWEGLYNWLCKQKLCEGHKLLLGQQVMLFNYCNSVGGRIPEF